MAEDAMVLDVAANLELTGDSRNITSNITLEQELDQFFAGMRGRVDFELCFYVPLFFIGSFSNLYVLTKLLRDHSNSRMHHLIRHLTIADAMVVLVTITIEIVWRITIRWPFGNAACKIAMFARAFGLYLTSCLLICISLDRYYAFVRE